MAEELLDNSINTSLTQTPDLSTMTETTLNGGDPPTKKRAALPKEESYEQAMAKSMASAASRTPFFGTGVTGTQYVDYEANKKYLEGDFGYIQGRDNEDIHARDQSWYTEIPKAIPKFVGYTITKLGTGVGFTLGLLDPSNWFSADGVVSSASDNAISETFAGLEERIKNDWAPTFQEAADRNKGFFSRAFTDLNFWTEDVVDGAAFMASAFIPGMALSKLGTGAKFAQLLSGLRVGANAANAVVDGAGMAQSYLSNAQKIAKGFDTFTTWATATAGEAMFEAKDTRDKVLESLNGKINPTTGAEYTEVEKKEIAGGAARNTFLMNAALLGITNAIQMKYMYKALGMSSPGSGNILQTGIGSAFAAEIPTSRLGKFLASNPGKVLEGVAAGTISEGYIEENTQLAIQRINERYGAQGKVLDLLNYGEVLLQAGKQVVDATLGNDTEAAMSIGLGSILGGGMSAVGEVRETNRERLNTDTAVSLLNATQTDWLKFGDIYQTEDVVKKDDKGNNVVSTKTRLDEKNEPIVDQEKLAAAISGLKVNLDQMRASDNSVDPNQVQQLRDSSFRNFVQAHIDAGIEDTINTKLDDALRATPEALAAMGFNPETGTNDVASLKQFASELIKQNKLIKSSVLTTGSPEVENARLRTLVDLAAQQTIMNRVVANITKEANEAKAGLVGFDISSGSDITVDAANNIQYRILAQERTIAQMKASAMPSNFQIEAAESLLKELKIEKAKFLKDNTLSLENLKVDTNDLYKYENQQRNEDPLNVAYQNALFTRGVYQNSARHSGLQFASLADTKSGLKNFLEGYIIDEIVNPINADLDAQEANQETGRTGKSIIITTTEKDSPIEQEIFEGEEYITAANEENKLFKGRVVKTFNNNLIKILAIDGDNITIRVNNNKSYIVSSDRFSDAGRLWPLSEMSVDERIYFKNRDIAFNINVSSKYGKLHSIKGDNAAKDYRRSGKDVKARLILQKEEGTNVLKIQYVNPVTKKTETVSYSRAYLSKYGDQKFDLRALPGEQEALDQINQDRIANNLNTQLQIFNQAVTDAQARLITAQAAQATNQATYEALRSQLIDDRAEFELTIEELDKYARKRGRRTTVHNNLIKSKGDISARIIEAQNLIDVTKAERASLELLVNELKQAKNLYEDTILELEINNIPFDRQGRETLAGATQEEFDTLNQEQITRRLDNKRVDDLITDTENEIDNLTSRINSLTGYVGDLRQVLKRVSTGIDFLDFLDLPSSVGTRKGFRDYLADKIAKEANPTVKKEYQELYRQVSKGQSMSGDIMFRDMMFLINSLKDSVEDLKNSEQSLIEAEQKFERLKEAQAQKAALSDLQERIDYLNTIQQVLTEGFEAQRPAVVTPVAVNNNPQNQDELQSETEISNDPYSPTFGNEKLPKFEEVGFNKTFGRQYKDDQDQEPITENGVERFFQFTSSQNVKGQDYSLMPVTADNDTFGIRPDGFPNDIKLVLVKKGNTDTSLIEAQRQADLALIDDKNFLTKTDSVLQGLLPDGSVIIFKDNVFYKLGETGSTGTVNGISNVASSGSIRSAQEIKDAVNLKYDKQLLEGPIQYIGQNGQVLENPTKDDLIYTSMADINSWTPERVRSSYSVASTTTDEQIQEIIDEQKTYQENIKNSIKSGTPVFLKATSTSPGIQRVETLTSVGENGLPQIAQAEAEGRVIEDNPDWTDLKSANNPEVNIELRVSTANGAIAPGLLPGRVVMQEFTYDNDVKIYGDKVTRVFTRPLLDSEKSTIIEALKRMSELFGRKSTTDEDLKLSEEEQNELNVIQQYLRNILAWGNPEKESLTNSSRFFFIQSGLNRGRLKIPFTADAIEANKEALLDGVFHHANNKSLKDNTDFSTIKIVDGRVLPDITYETYQEYLLAKRENGDVPPVYTSLPRADSGIPQRTQSFINWVDPNVEPTRISVEREVVSTTVEQAPVNEPEMTLEEKLEKFINYEYKGKIQIGKITLSYVPREGGVSIQFRNEKGVEKHSPVFSNAEEIKANREAIEEGIKQATGYIIGKNKGLKTLAAAPATPSLPDTQSAQLPTTPAPAPIQPATGGLSGLRNLGARPAPPTQAELRQEFEANQQGTPVDTSNPAVAAVLAQNAAPSVVEEVVVPNIIEEFPTDIETAVNNAKPVKGFLSAKLYNYNAVTGEYIQESEATVPIANGILASRRALRVALINNLSEDEAPFRMVTTEEVMKLEDFKALDKFMSSNLPQIAVNRMANLISGKAWGAFTNGSIYIYENAEHGTGFHEAFEAVWASFLTDTDQERLAKEFRARKGQFTNPFNLETKDYKDATDYDVREMLAEEFRDYVINDGTTVTPSNGISKFFKELWNAIKALFSMSPSTREELDNNINRVFKKIGTGGFKRAVPISERNEVSPQYRLKVPGLTLDESNSALEGLTYHFFRALFEDGKSIDTILSELTPEQSRVFVNDLFEKAHSNVLVGAARISKRYTDVLEANKTQLFHNLKTSLERYGLTFDEDILNKEETATDTLGIRDSITVNPQKMTAVNVKLLIASLPNTTYTSKGVPVVAKNSLNQPQLVDYSKTHNMLLNELSNLVPYVDATGKRHEVLDLMFEHLDGKYKNPVYYKQGYAWIKNLKLRLKYEDINGVRVPLESLTSDDIRLRISFIKSFTNNKNTPEKTIAGEAGYLYNLNPVNNVNTDRVKQEWTNNIKDAYQNKESDIINVDNNGRMTFNKSGQDFKFLMDTLHNKAKIDLNKSVEALEKLGIVFTSDKRKLSKYEGTIRENLIQILTLLENGVINTMADLYGTSKVSGRIDSFLDLEAKFSAEDTVLSYMNSDGQSQYSVGIPSLFGQMINIINSVNSLKALVQTAPWLGNIDSTTGEVRLFGYAANSELLRKGGPIFNQQGNRRSGANVGYHVISGLGTSDYEGKSTDVLQYPERVANKIHYLMRNIVYTNINSDKSTEFGLGIPGKPLASVTNISRLLYQGSSPAVTDIYINHLIDELYTALNNRTNPSNIQYYKTQVEGLGHFRDVMGKAFIDQFTSEVLDGNKYTGPTAHLSFVRDNRSNIESIINSYITTQTDKTMKELINLDMFELDSTNGNTLYTTDAIDNDTLRNYLGVPTTQKVSITLDNEVVERIGFTEANIRTLAASLSVNEEILLTEQHKLIYGHPVFYKDLPKRANGATSTKEQMVEDGEIIRWMDDKMPRNDKKTRSDELHQTIKVISFKDNIVVSKEITNIAEGIFKDMNTGAVKKSEIETYLGARFDEQGKLTEFIMKGNRHTGAIAPYADLNEADAEAWGMPDIIRDMLYLTGKLTKEQEAQFAYEMAYEKLALSERGEKFSKQELETAQSILDQGNPGYIFQVLKPQYFGYAENADMMHPTFLKNSVQPKFFRHVEGTQFEEMYLAAKADQVDVIGFESGEKVGNVENNTKQGGFTPLYNPDGKVNLNRLKSGKVRLPSELAQQKLYSKFWGIQVEMSSKSKDTVVRGTQVTKLIMVNSYENGAPISPEMGKLVAEYNRTLVEMMQNSKRDLIKELGLRVTPNGYETDDVTELVKTLRKEAESRELPDNMVDGIAAMMNEEGNQVLKYQFDTLNNSSKIDNILNSIVDSRVISEKIHGKASVQVANTLYESNPRSYTYLKNGQYAQLTEEALKTITPEERKSIQMTSADLKFYTNNGGKTTKMEVYISWPFKDISPESLGLVLENGVYKPQGNSSIDNRLLTSLGFRIPTQAMNSIESMIIKGFTPANNGDMIVVPSEMVGKSGSDFDIDKLNIYLGNYYQDGKSGKITYVEYKGSVEKTRKFYEDLYDDGGLLTKSQQESFDSFVKKLNDVHNPDVESNLTNFLMNATKEEGTLTSFLKNMFNDTALTQEFFEDMLGSEDKKSRIVDAMVKKALQNHLMETMNTIIEHPSNYRQLVTPNSVDTIKGLATEISKLKIDAGTKTVQNEKSYNYLRTFLGASEIRERYLTAKRMVGIAALHSTFHSMAQVSGTKLRGMFRLKGLKYLSSPNEEWRTINIKLRNNSEQENGTYNIGSRLDAAGNLISESGSEKLSGFVDGAKDPFVFDLNLNMNTASTWFYLDHHGVPQRDIAYFFNQPILDQYFSAQSRNNSGFKAINGKKQFPEGLFYDTIRPYYKKLTGIDIVKELEDWKKNFKMQMKIKQKLKEFLVNNNNKFDKFTVTELREAIIQGKGANPELQLAVLYNYLELSVQGRFLSNYIQAIGYDNSKTKSIQENQMQVAKWDRSVNDKFIDNPSAVLENTFIGEMKIQKEDVFSMFKEFFVTLSPKVQGVFAPIEDMISDPDFFASKNDMAVLLQRYQNFVLSYILHTTPYVENEVETVLNTHYQEMIFGNESMAKRLSHLRKSEDPSISENIFVRELLPLMTDDNNKTDNISMFRNRLDTYNINKLTESLSELKEYAADIADNDLLSFVNDLTKFSLIQSGLQPSSINYSTVLPTEIYSEEVKKIITSFIESSKELDVDDVWYNFHANQWRNTSIVPRAPYWLKVRDGQMLISGTSAAAANPWLTKTVRRPGLSSKQVTELVKEKRFDEAFDTLLLRRSSVMNSDGKYVYTIDNKKGDGPRFTEISPSTVASVMPKNISSIEPASASSGGFVAPSNDVLKKLFPGWTEPNTGEGTSFASDEAPSSDTNPEVIPDDITRVLNDKDQGCKK